jgi:probable phosphoglycerate mutase
MDMGGWGGRYYRDIKAEVGRFVDKGGFFKVRPPAGEWFDGVAERLRAWLADCASENGERLVIMHGISSRVLRGMLTGAAHRPGYDAPVAEGLPQGSIVRIEDGVETILHLGNGTHGGSRPAAPA